MHGADAPAHAALRPSRRPRRADGAVRRVGDAGAVRGRDPGAPGRAHGRRRLRRLAHGRDRGRRAARTRVAAVAPVERPRPDRDGPGAVHAADERARRHRRRSDRVPPRRVPVPARRQRVEPRGRLPLDQGARDLGLRRSRPLRRVRTAGRPGAECDREARPAARTVLHVRRRGDRRRRGDGEPDGLHRRGRLRGHVRRGGRRRAVGCGDRTRGRSVRPRRARHAPARGLLPVARQRHLPGDGSDLRRARLGVRARQGVHRRRRASPHQGAGAGAEARRRS